LAKADMTVRDFDVRFRGESGHGRGAYRHVMRGGTGALACIPKKMASNHKN